MTPSLRFSWNDLPLVTGDLPGTGGRIREEPADFRVAEIPSYLPAGKGSHLYLLVRKSGRTTRDLVTALMGAGVSEKEIGVAGLKDKAAVTEQWLSVPNRHAAASEILELLEGVTVLRESRHRNKLGMGHLRGNRFRIRIRGATADAAARAEAVLARLAQIGSPNYYGPQRFGRFGTNACDGLRLVRGEWVPGGHRLKRFFVSSLQSQLFNALLAERIERGIYREVLVGDWARKHSSGGMFTIDTESERLEALPRAERLEISAALPLYGRRVRTSAGDAGALEKEVCSRFGLGWNDFVSRRGDRRSSRLIVEEWAVEPSDGGAILTFALPKGAYATTVLREVMKIDVDAPLEPRGETLSEHATDDPASLSGS